MSMSGNLSRIVPTILAVIIGVLASMAAFTAVRQYTKNRSDAEFASLVHHRANLVEEGFSTAFFAIQSVGALYDTVGDVSAEQFAGFVDPLLRRFPTITALGWVPRVRESERTAFGQAARRLSRDFRITERSAQGVLREASGRESYFPVLLIQPRAGNEAAIGFDIYSNPIRRAAIDMARKTGETISTARIRLVQETGEQYSVLLIHPVFEKDRSLGHCGVSPLPYTASETLSSRPWPGLNLPA